MSSETTRFHDHLVGLFCAAAPQLLAWFDRGEHYKVALATGYWLDAARAKMTSAGMDYDSFPSASADDAPEREAIIELAVARAAIQDGRFDGSVYVGDGIWDARACRPLGIPFIGIGVGSRAGELWQAGAVHVFADLADIEGFVQALQTIEMEI